MYPAWISVAALNFLIEEAVRFQIRSSKWINYQPRNQIFLAIIAIKFSWIFARVIVKYSDRHIIGHIFGHRIYGRFRNTPEVYYCIYYFKNIYLALIWLVVISSSKMILVQGHQCINPESPIKFQKKQWIEWKLAGVAYANCRTVLLSVWIIKTGNYH